MMKQKLKKLLALALSLIMMSSLITPLFPTAQAAGSGVATLADAGGGDNSGAVTEGDKVDYYDTDGGRPNLYVDFLGDNKKYRPNGGDYSDALNIPAGYDQSAVTNKSANPLNTWNGYTQDDCTIAGTIFWVGVGVDRVQVLKLLEGEEGLASLELGFYYNNRYIEPYTGADGDFAAAITAANINNTAYPKNTQWSDSYVIRHAETGLPIADTADADRPFLPGVTDEVTREPMRDPSIEEIGARTLPDGSDDSSQDNWKMTYISLEMGDLTDFPKRGGRGDANWPSIDDKGTKFDKEYFETNEDGTPKKEGFPEAASGNDGPQYLLLIPFRLKRYDSDRRLCLRLIRDATHFSIGAGEEGVEPYAAWEKTTTRNPGHDLKLLTRFTGDLNIFTGAKIRTDPTYIATLVIVNGGDSRNHAELGIADDPSINPVKVEASYDHISNLQEGTGMQVRIRVQPGFKATVAVYEPTVEGNRYVHQVVIDQEDYRFVMPASNVTVVVTFEKDRNQDPTIFLSEIFKGDGTRKEGNNTTIETDQGAITSWSETQSHLGLHSAASGIVHPDETPAGPAKPEQTITVKVSTHADYIAKVRIYNFADQKWVDQMITATGVQSDVSSTGVVTLPYGGEVTFEMPDSNMDVEVTYEPAEFHTAKLEVWHYENAITGYKTPVSTLNVAQLAYHSYDEQNIRSTAYSGKVYEDASVSPSNHSAVKPGSDLVSWVPKSAAAMSDSLGGDTTRTGMRTWTDTNAATGTRAIMSQLYAATDPAIFAESLKDINYATMSIAGSVSGFRRTLQGETYGDNELYYTGTTDEIGLANVLWELRTRILQDAALSASYLGTVNTTSTPPSIAYRYINLTPAQVQAYILEMLQAQEHRRLNELRYRELSNGYQKVLKLRQAKIASGYAEADLEALQLPELPRGISVDATTGVRTYEGVGYRTTYANSYEQYITAYEAYLNNLSTTTAFDTTKTPVAVPAEVTVSIVDATTAASRVAGQGWRARTNNQKAEITTRSGRTVWVALEADSRYTERTIEIYNAETNVLIESKNVTADTDQTGYRNVYAITMPNDDCIIRVTYRIRPRLDLDFEINGADSKVDNLTTIDAYTVNENSITPNHVTRNNASNQSLRSYKGSITDILDGSYIDVLVKTAQGYTVSVTALDESTGNTVIVTPVAAPNPADGVIYRIHAQNNDPEKSKKLKLVVTYAPEVIELNTAIIQGETYPSDPIDSRNIARWDTINGASRKQNVAEGTDLLGVICVAPGYYIHSVTATGASGTYSYTLDGNGYNNGFGTYAGDGTTVKIPIQLTTVMPDEDLLVTVTFRRGLPPVNPGTRLTLTVKDDENTGTPPADNWAKATIVDTNPAQTLGPVGLATGNGLTTYDYVEAGQVVEVEYAAASGYYVDSVKVGPDQLGVEVTWQPGNKIRFVMPPASAGVTVEFKKGNAPSYFLRAYRTENGKALTASWPNPGDPTQTVLNPNRIIGVASNTIQGFMSSTDTYTPTNATNPERIPDPINSNGIGAAVAGEQVTVTFKASEGWYVHSVVVASGQSAWVLPFAAASTNNSVVVTSGNNDGVGESTFSATFTMPSGDAEFVVNYRNLPMPVNPEYMVNLIVRDRDNVNDPATGSVVVDNWVRGSYTGGTTGITTPAEADRSKLGAYYPSQLDVLYPQGGDTVNLEYQLQPGFAIDYIAVTPAGLPLRRIYPVFEATTTDAGGVVHGKATFTMPGEDVTVIASIVKGPPHKYNANLILRPPAGVDVNRVGQGTFASPTAGTLDNYPDNAIFSLLTEPGTPIDLSLFAKDGYYIRAITIDPATGATATLSGSFGRQSGHFVMPAADVNVNVWFEKKWPDEVQYDLTLEVIDPSFTSDNFAAFRSAGGRALDDAHVVGNKSKTLTYAAFDKEQVVVDIHAAAGFHASRSSIRVTDSAGQTLEWRFVPGKDGGQAIAFIMPPLSTKVTVTFYRDGDPDEPDPPRTDYEAVLHLTAPGAGDTAALTDGAGQTADQNGEKLTNLRGGQTLELNVAHGTDRVVAAAYAVSRSTGEQIMLPITLVTEGGTDAFAMPEDNVDVYVTFKAVTEPPASGDRVMRLVVAGPVGSGSATMTQDSKPANTIAVDAHGGDFLWAAEEERLTVTLKPQAGYYIAELTVTDGNNAGLSYDWISMISDGAGGWTKNPDQQITLTVPPAGGTVYVRYEKIPEPTPDDPDGPKYTAQIVVNDEMYSSTQNIPSRNDAWFTGYPSIDPKMEKRWREAKPGDWVDLSLTVHEGYKIEYVILVPQKYGIAPSLPLGPIDSQSTGFVMPADDVVVYVKFVRDDQPRFNARLVVNGVYNPPANPGDPVNEAKISSAYSGTAGPIHAGQDPVTVRAAKDRETVTVDYTWDADSSVASITVKEDGSGVDVPFTQVTPGQITLPMVGRNITITVTYRDDPEPVGYPVILHVMDNSPNGTIQKDTAGWARLVYDPAAAYNAPAAGAGQDTDKQVPLPKSTANPWGHTVDPIQVPAGKLVDLTAFTGTDENGDTVYVESAYVLYEAGGQMISLRDNMTPTSSAPGLNGVSAGTDSNVKFAVHPGRNDVYVTLTTTPPKENEFAAVLMLKGPAGDTTSRATIYVGDDYQTAARRDIVSSNVGHGYVLTEEGEKVTVSVTCPGYVIERVLITPLGDPNNPIMTWTNNTGTFTMPRQNVAVTVYLKESNERVHSVTLHYLQTGSADSVRAVDETGEGNRANVFWTPDGAAVTESIVGYGSDDWNDVTGNACAVLEKVAENAEITITATLDSETKPDGSKRDYTILAAYVLRGATLVPLSNSLEGATETVSTTTNHGVVDATATFTMPGQDVHVYVVVTDTPPEEPDWHTAVLLTTDKRGVLENAGSNYATIRDDNVPPVSSRATTGTAANPAMGHTFITVWKDQRVRVAVDGENRPDYQFDRPATISHSVAGVDTTMDSLTGLTEELTSPYVYRYTVGDYNSAVHVHFVGSQAEKINLNVAIDDWDNPSNKTVTNAVTATPSGMTPLTLVSETSAGAYQIIPDVDEGKTVTVAVAPHAGYYAVVTVKDKDGTVIPFADGTDLVTLAAAGIVQFTMPSVDTTVTVRFYLPHRATLKLVDRNSDDPTSQAQMVEDLRGDKVVVHQINREDTIHDLPRGTLLTANMTELSPTGKLTAVLRTVNGSTTFLSPTAEDGVDYYRDTMGRDDVTITFVVDKKDSDRLVAAVRTINKPAGAADPTVSAPSAGEFDSGSIWTLAEAGEAVTTNITVPDGYRVEVTARQADGTTVSFTGGNTVGLTANGNAVLTMPNQNVLITVRYIKTVFTLTVQVTGTEYAQAAYATLPDSTTLQDGQSAQVAEKAQVDVTAAPNADARLIAAYYRTAGGTVKTLTPPLGVGVGYTGDFEMPSDDTVLHLVFGPYKEPTPDDPDPDENYYIAMVETVGGEDLPNNQVLSILNMTRTKPEDKLPDSSPDWAAGMRGDQMTVAFTTEPGWTATVTARTQTTPERDVTVVQQGITGDCTATIFMPGGANVIITIEYKQEEPPEENTLPITLRLVDHDAQPGNKAVGTSDSAGLLGLAVAGNSTHGLDDVTLADPANAKSAIRVTKEATRLGERLTVVADWQSGYQVVKITVAVPVTSGTGNDSTGNYLETEILPVSRYGTKAAARLYVPGKDAIVTVYYSNIFTATLNIVGAGTGDDTAMTDSRTNPVTSTGVDPVTNSGDRLLQLAGGETITTTAIPGTNRRLAGVVYESELTGAQQTLPPVSDPNPNHEYTFSMPRADTDVYVYYEETPENEKDKHYIAKVAIDGDSQGYGLSDGMGGRNQVSIRNVTDPTASGGKYWVGAKAEDEITITVNLIPGYQAVVISAKMDDTTKRPTPETSFDYYVTRTRFVVSGKTTTFSMPAETDATVTVKYIRGYDLKLEMKDATASVNQARLTADGSPLQGDSDGRGNVTYVGNNQTLTGLIAGSGTDTAPQGTWVNTALTLGEPSEHTKTRVTRYTPFTGAVLLPEETTDSHTYADYPLPAENTVESVLFWDDRREDNLLAKVEVKGESDINGNTATPIVDTNTPDTLNTVTGTVWTTTKGGQKIDLTITVAVGYVAKIQVRRDNKVYWDNLGDASQWQYLTAADYDFEAWDNYSTPPTRALTEVDGKVSLSFVAVSPKTGPLDDFISAKQHFTFTMPENRAAGTNGPDDAGDEESDVTVIVEFVYVSDMPAPYDPDHTNAGKGMPDNKVAKLKEGFIYAENRGDYALVDIPTLEKDGILNDTDVYGGPVKFQFYLYDPATDVYTELILGQDVETAAEDEATLRSPGDSYNYYTTHHSKGGDNYYTGARFRLLPRADAGGNYTAGGQALWEMLNNAGSLDAALNTRLYVTAEANGNESSYTEVWIRPAYTLALRVTSWGPGHGITANLHALLEEADLPDGETLDKTNFAHYSAQPTFTSELAPLEGQSDKWRQVVRIRSSELLGDYLTEGQPHAATYALTVEKVSNITYRRVNIVLMADEEVSILDENKQYFYQAKDGDEEKRTFRIQDEVKLIAGDADGDGLTKWQDYELIRRYVEWKDPWSDIQTKPADYATNATSKLLWDASVYNPESMAYRCDLNSDGVLSIADLNVLTTYDNYNQSVESYNWAGDVLPNGMKAPDFAGPAELFSLRPVEEWVDEPAPYDPVGDAQVIPAELRSEAQETPTRPVNRGERPETPVDPGSASAPDPGELAEPDLPIVMEEAVENPAALPPAPHHRRDEEQEELPQP